MYVSFCDLFVGFTEAKHSASPYFIFLLKESEIGFVTESIITHPFAYIHFLFVYLFGLSMVFVLNKVFGVSLAIAGLML